jgi:biopolymer transport protein ExbB
MLLFQISTPTTDSLATPAVTESSLSLLDLILKGGVIMVPIFLLSIIAFVIFFERLFTIKAASKDQTSFMDRVKMMVLQGDISGAKMLCAQTNSPIARMIGKGIARLGRPLKDIESSVENTGKIEIYKLERNLSVLGIIAGIAPMLGFVGTIAGVIRIFYNISLADNISIGLIAGGLYEKMITSAAGLIVGIIAHAGYHYLNLLIDRIVYRMESNALDFIDLLQENK